jgi:DNA-binding NarL/FixJ family response regulator
VATHKPYVNLFDYDALRPNRKRVIAWLRRAVPSARTLVLATAEGAERTIAVLRAGATGLVGTHLGNPAPLAALHAVAAGEPWTHRGVTAQAIDELISPRLAPRQVPIIVTKWKWKVVDSIGNSLRSPNIARSFGISGRTAENHLNSTFSKTNLNSRPALAS